MGSNPGRMYDWRGSQALYQSATSPSLTHIVHVSVLSAQLRPIVCAKVPLLCYKIVCFYKCSTYKKCSIYFKGFYAVKSVFLLLFLIICSHYISGFGAENTSYI